MSLSQYCYVYIPKTVTIPVQLATAPGSYLQHINNEILYVHIIVAHMYKYIIAVVENVEMDKYNRIAYSQYT